MRLFIFFAAALAFYACKQQPYQMGERLYKTHCANCHLDNGEGLGGLIPPLAKADFLEKERQRLPCILRHGLQDTIAVNGRVFAEKMAANNYLTDIQITNVLNFVLQSWGNNQQPFSFEEVQKSLENCQ